jgi:acetyl-CoA acetyltransferase
MSKVYIAGISMTKFGPHPDKSVKDLTRLAVTDALSDATASVENIESAYFSNVMQNYIEGQVCVPGEIALRAAGIEGIPIVNVENACASGSSAVWLAINQLRAGSADIVLAVGAEKLSFKDEERQERRADAFVGGMDIYDIEATSARLAALSEDTGGESGGGRRSFFMDLYAYWARAHMSEFGSTQEQMALISSKNHFHSTLNDKCHYNRPMSVEEVLAGRPLGYPLTVPMCSPYSDGASAAVLVNEEGLRKLGTDRAVEILSCQLSSSTEREWKNLAEHTTARAARRAYEEAGIGPQDISVAEVHDAAAFGELLQTEILGFCDYGEGGILAESGATRLGGRIPVNPSGGLESKGHPLGATGIAQLYELVTQLRGEAGARQVENARLAIQENGGGLLGVEEACGVVTILGKAGG